MDQPNVAPILFLILVTQVISLWIEYKRTFPYGLFSNQEEPQRKDWRGTKRDDQEVKDEESTEGSSRSEEDDDGRALKKKKRTRKSSSKVREHPME